MHTWYMMWQGNYFHSCIFRAQSHWPSPLSGPPPANGDEPGARREWPLGSPPPVAPHPEGWDLIHGADILPCISTTTRYRGRKSIYSESILPRTAWNPQSHRHVADWLGRVEPALPGKDMHPFPVWKSLPKPLHTRRGQHITPVSDILSYLCNSDSPATKNELSRVNTAPHDVKTQISLADR